MICPSNPVVSIGPILAVPGIRSGRGREAGRGVSPIVGGRPLAGMADRLMPVVGLEVSAVGAARAYADLLDGVGDRPSRRGSRGARARRGRREGRRHRHGDARRRGGGTGREDGARGRDMTIELIPLEGIPEVEPGDDLPALLEPALASPSLRATATSSRSRRRSCRRRRAASSPATIGRRGWNGNRSPSSRDGATSSSRGRGTASCARTRVSTHRTSPRVPHAAP